MKPADLNRAVARATGETVDRVARIGFSLILVPARPRPPLPAQNRQALSRRPAPRRPQAQAA